MRNDRHDNELASDSALWLRLTAAKDGFVRPGDVREERAEQVHVLIESWIG